MGLGSFFSDPNAALAFNISQGAISGLGSLFGSRGRQRPSAAAVLAQSQTGFDNALAIQQQAINSEVDLQNAQADLAILEANRDAQIKADEVNAFTSKQELAYSASGIYLPGSPSAADVVNDTLIKGQQEINAIMDRASAQARVMRLRAQQVQNQGAAVIAGKRSDFLTSMLNAHLSDNEQQYASGGGLNSILSSLFQTPGAGVPRNFAPRIKRKIPAPNTVALTPHGPIKQP